MFFWIGASDVSFLLPLLDWRQRQAECRRSERRGVPHGTPLRFTVAGSLSVGVERLRQCIQSRFAREFRIGCSQCTGEFVGRENIHEIMRIISADSRILYRNRKNRFELYRNR